MNPAENTVGSEPAIADDGPPPELQVQQLAWMAEHYPDQAAYVRLDTGESLSFAQWDAAANRLARGFVGLGVTPGDRISIHVDNPEIFNWIISYAAIHKAGAVAVPTNTRLTAEELGHVLGHAEPTVVITTAEGEPKLHLARREPWIKHVLVVDQGGLEATMSNDSSPFQSPVAPHDLADIMYTSGTTGLPKGIAVEHRNLHILPNTAAEWTGASWIHGSPLFTFAGISFIYNPMKMGMTALFMPRFDAGQWLSEVAHRKPSMAFLVPAMAQLISTHTRFESTDLDSLEIVAIGSAPLPPALHLRLADRLPDATVSNNYSMTEAGTAFALLPKEEVHRREGSVGIPIGTEIRVTDGAGAVLEPGEIGHIEIGVGENHRHYYKNPEATAQMWSGEWLKSGDLGWLDEDGYLYITGRAKDVIIRGGNNVHAADVEAILYQHPCVAEAAVAAVPHEVLGEDVGAWVVLREDCKAPGDCTAEDLIAHCRDRLADYKCPRTVTFVDALPRNPTGKVLKHELPPADLDSRD